MPAAPPPILPFLDLGNHVSPESFRRFSGETSNFLRPVPPQKLHFGLLSHRHGFMPIAEDYKNCVDDARLGNQSS